MTQQAIQAEALGRARSGLSWSNYAAIIGGFMDKGVPESEIIPRENVFTFHAWKALGRQVRKGEHGVKVLTYIVTPESKRRQAEAAEGEETRTVRRPWTTTVFHVSQTEPIARS